MKDSNLRSEYEIQSIWKNDNKEPMVSISCTTYNHEGYIGDALDGFLIQETDFPFEILIHDDASTDNTANIIREYELKYPHIIKPIYQTENQYSQGVKVSSTFNYPRVKGKYIAKCEGDDYWTDPKKLQIQVDFLEKNPEYVISGHNTKVVDSRGNTLCDSLMPIPAQRDFSAEELIIGKAWLPTLTWVFRNLDFGPMPESKRVLIGDKFFASVLGNFGKSKFHDNIQPAAYRMHDGGIWSPLDDTKKRDEEMYAFYMLYKYYTRLNKPQYAQAWYDKMSFHAISGMSKQALLNFYVQLHSTLGV